jgi:ATP synthase assembly factor FMC1
MYATLLERYNPGMNMEEEERVRLTARRVGMELPEVFTHVGSGQGEGGGGKKE